MQKQSLFSLIAGCVLGAGLAVTGLHFVDRPTEPGANAVATLAGDEAAARLREILAHTEPLQRIADLSALLPSVDPSAAPAVAEVFETAVVDPGDPVLVLFGIWWAEHDPQAAYAWTTTDWRARHANVIAAVVRVWAHTDPKTALGAARALVFPYQRELATDAATAGWDESGQPGLLESLSQFNATEVQQIGEGIARRRVVTLGPEGALRWADDLEQGPFRDMLSVRVASAVAGDANGVRFAAEWARPRVSTEKGVLSSYPRRIGTRWVHHDPEAAMAWLASLPAGDDRDDGVAESFRTWSRRDQASAHAWVEKTDMQRWNEPAIAVYARAIARERPKEAIELARRLTDESWREPTTVVIGQFWSDQDPEAAKAWLAQADLPEHTRRTAAMVRNSNPANARPLEELQRAIAPSAGGVE